MPPQTPLPRESVKLRRGHQNTDGTKKEKAWASGSDHGHHYLLRHHTTYSFTPAAVKVNKQTAHSSVSEDVKHEHGIDPKTRQASTRPGEYFCVDCQQSKQAADYATRFNDLTSKSLYCHGCHAEHRLALFDSSQWANEVEINTQRNCIGHQGRMRICPHLSFSLDCLVKKNWNMDRRYRNGYVYIQCTHPDHLCQTIHYKADVSITIRAPSILLTPVPRRTGLKAVTIRMCLDPWKTSDLRHMKDNEDDSGMQAWMKRLVVKDRIDAGFEADAETRMQVGISSVLDIFESSSFMICPHFRMTPYRLTQIYGSGLQRRIRCVECELRIKVRDPVANKKTPPVTLQASWFPRVSLQCGTFLCDWLSLVDPDSYGHFTDQATKHLLWCDDRSCATTYEGIWARLLREHAVSPDSIEAECLSSMEDIDLDKRNLSEVERVDIETLFRNQLSFRGVPYHKGTSSDVKKALALYGLKP